MGKTLVINLFGGRGREGIGNLRERMYATGGQTIVFASIGASIK
jgi:hypothetical protein